MMHVMIPALRRSLDDTDDSFRLSVARQLGIDAGEVKTVRVLRQAVDARKKRDVFFSVHGLVDLSGRAARRVLADKKLHAQLWEEPTPVAPVHGKEPLPGRVVVVGMGPSGLFAGYLLAREGYLPLIVDRGKAMDERVQDVDRYWRTGRADPESNPLFGEGGAGTFSDGKLTARSKDWRCATVLDTFLACGAPEEIGVLSKPHVGTDRLRQVVKNLREEILHLGGEVRFSTRLEAIRMKDGRIRSATLVHDGVSEEIDCGALVLAIGQGARDTYRYLSDAGFALAPKPFAVGVRAEHPQTLINESQYGPFAGHPKLGAADYKLTAQASGRGVYSFCMCPGGFVVGAGAGPKEMVVNGMSHFDRAGQNANAALVVQVFPKDFGEGPLDGMRFQQRLEQAAWDLGGGEGLAPACRMEDFLAGRRTLRFGAVRPTFRPGVTGADLNGCLPPFVADGLREAMAVFARQIKGFDMPDAVLTAVESRTSAPVRILRGEDMQSLTHGGVYPVGEGAGYAGGIVSSAVDGLKAAEAIISQFRPARP
ncbi:MAG: hypothetical protein IJQ45_07865 [Clostridia bacterium]|nr:hypothetical protein [Clostridia bacterium]